MNCFEARPLLMAGDPAAESHLEGCAACGRWLEAEDPVVFRIREARPEALPAPSSLRRRVLSRWSPPGRVPLPAIQLGGLTAALVAAATFALAVFRPEAVTRAGDYGAPLLHVFQGPRDLLLDNLPALVLMMGVGIIAIAVAGVIYRDLGTAPRRLA